MPFMLLSPWPSENLRIWIAFWIVLIYSAILIAQVLRNLASIYRGRKDAHISDHARGYDGFSVQIRVNRNGTPVGSDRGVVWFENALFGFSGEKTSFLLAASDLVRPEEFVLTNFDATIVR